MSDLLSALQAVGQLFGGYGLVTLGPVVLTSMEVPDRIPVGGQQMLAIHKLPGGQRVIDAMGRDDADMGWHGILRDLNAESRMHLLDGLRQSGQPIQLAFGTSSFTVIVRHFVASYERTNWIPYTIGCTVVQDNAAQWGSAPPSLLGQLNADLNSALGFDVAATTSAALSAAQAALVVAGALDLGSSAFISASAALSKAQGLLQAEQAASSGTMSGIVAAAATAGNLLGVTQVSQGAAAFSAAASAAADLANTAAASGYVGRSVTNLANASA